MGNLVTLEPGMTLVFHTVFECRSRGDIDVQKINRGNFGTYEAAGKEKKRLEKKLSGKWVLDNEGRFIYEGRNPTELESRWFFVKRRKVFIQG